MNSNILIRIVDDDEAFADAVSFMLTSKGWRTAVYLSVAEFLEKDDRSVPGCILLDYLMPDISGTEAQKQLAEEECPLPIVFLTAHADLDMAISVFRTGAVDLLRKPVEPEALYEAVSRAAAKDRRSSLHVSEPLPAAERFAALTRRERQIVELAAYGLSNGMIADRYGISERTVEAHRSGAYKRLGVRNLEELQLLIRELHSEESREAEKKILRN